MDQPTGPTARDRGIAHEQWTSAQLRERFPAFDVHDEESALFEPRAGVLNPERCIAVQLNLAQNSGAIVRTNEDVLRVEPTNNGVRVHTSTQVHTADHVVLATGTQIALHLPIHLTTHIRTYRQVLHWFDIEASYEQFRPAAFPVFLWQASDNDHDMFYGFPAVNGPAGGIKVATEQHEIKCDPHSIDPNVSSAEIDEMFERLCRKSEVSDVDHSEQQHVFTQLHPTGNTSSIAAKST